MIIKARHHWFYYPFFKGYSRLLPRLDFREVVYHSEVQDGGLPVLLIGNHFSWWDGFLALDINQRLFGRRFHIMMLEEQLRERMFLNKSGAYSIRPGHRSMAETFAYTRELLSDPGNLVTMYPQGKIYSMHDQPFLFEKGWYRIIEKLEQPVQMVFYFALVDYFSHRKPTLNIYVYAHEDPYEGANQVEAAFNERFRDALAIQRIYLEGPQNQGSSLTGITKKQNTGEVAGQEEYPEVSPEDIPTEGNSTEGNSTEGNTRERYSQESRSESGNQIEGKSSNVNHAEGNFRNGRLSEGKPGTKKNTEL